MLVEEASTAAILGLSREAYANSKQRKKMGTKFSLVKREHFEMQKYNQPQLLQV